MLSPILRVVESIWVVVPFTVKLPLIVTFPPLAVIAVFNDEVYEFNSAIDVLSVDAELINEPVIVANALFWVNCEPLNVFKFVIDTFKLAVVVSKFVNLVELEPVKVANVPNLVSTEPVYVPNVVKRPS